MKYWVMGIGLGVLALVLLYAASVVAQDSPYISWLFLAAVALTVVGVFGVITRATAGSAPPPPEYNPVTDRAGPRFEVPETPADSPHPWAGAGRTAAVMAAALAGLLIYVGIYVGAFAGLLAWIIYPALALTVLLFVFVLGVTAGRSD